MSDQGHNPPAGWYPDPENPGQQRYWDGGQWAAPQASPTQISQAAPGNQTEVMSAGPTAAGPMAAAAPGPDEVGAGGGGNRKVLGIVAALAAIGLIGGGLFFLTRDSGGTDVLSPGEFASAVGDICEDMEDQFADLDDALGSSSDWDEVEAIVKAGVRDLVSEFRKIAPEDSEETWEHAVDDLEAAADRELTSFADLAPIGQAFDRIERRFDVDCAGEGGSDSATVTPGPDVDDFDLDDFDLDDFGGFDDLGFDDFDDFDFDLDLGDLDDLFGGFDQFEDMFGDFDFGDLEDMFGEFEDLFGEFDLDGMFDN